MTLGEKLKQLRLNKNISQKDIAEYFKIARSTWSQYETNQREPNIAMLLKISDYFNISLDELLKDRKHCEYCEGKNNKRKDLAECEYGYIAVLNEKGTDKLSFVDNKMYDVKINYCPMCGRKLGE